VVIVIGIAITYVSIELEIDPCAPCCKSSRIYLIVFSSSSLMTSATSTLQSLVELRGRLPRDPAIYSVRGGSWSQFDTDKVLSRAYNVHDIAVKRRVYQSDVCRI